MVRAHSPLMGSRDAFLDFHRAVGLDLDLFVDHAPGPGTPAAGRSTSRRRTPAFGKTWRTRVRYWGPQTFGHAPASKNSGWTAWARCCRRRSLPEVEAGITPGQHDVAAVARDHEVGDRPAVIDHGILHPSEVVHALELYGRSQELAHPPDLRARTGGRPCLHLGDDLRTGEPPEASTKPKASPQILFMNGPPGGDEERTRTGPVF